tara:strand:+ start:959 stop:1300 length:342 start_codon:yes stop_codon:yes gene_type:complete
MAILDFLSKPFEPHRDQDFLEWYADIAKRSGVSSDPSDPRHYYDYKAAYEAGVDLDDAKHMPSEFKHDLHPDRYIIGKDLEIYDSKYNKKAKLEDMIIQSFQRKEFEENLWEK